MSLTPKNWSDFQHYKDRAPPWIKLHRTLLDNYEFHCLPVASRALAPMLWLLASEYEGGKITLSIPAMAFRLRMTEPEIAQALKPLISGGFFVDDGDTLAACYQEAIPEKERETQEKIEKEPCRVANATPTARKVLRIDYSEEFNSFWLAYPRTPIMSKTEAWTEWKKLSPEDRLAATASLSGFKGFLKSKPDHEVIHACRYLKHRRFDGFSARASPNVRSNQEVWAMIEAEQERLANGKI